VAARRDPAARRPRAPRLLAAAVAAVGAIGFVSALTPALASRSDLLSGLVPTTATDAARLLALLASLLLVLLAGGLRRRKRRAWQLACAALGLTAAAHVAKGLDVGDSALTLIALGSLVSRRRDFHVEGDPETSGRFLRHAALAVAVGVALALVLVEAQSGLGGDALRPAQALREALLGLVGLGPQRLSGHAAHIVPWALVAYTICAGGWLAFLWLRPRSEHRRELERDRRDAHALVARHGADSLAYFSLRRDKSYLFTEQRDAFLAYRVAAGVALVSGDPIGAEGSFDELLDLLVDRCERHGWRIAVLGASAAMLPLWRERGLRTLYVGDEAIVEPAAFSLEGRAIRKVRQSCHRLRRAGYRVELLRRDELSEDLLADLRRVSRAWLRGGADRGFSMALDDLWSPEHPDCVFACALDPAGRAAGFVHLVPSGRGEGLSLSAMRRLEATPNGLTEFVLVELFAWAQTRGIERISLNFNAFGELLRSDRTELPRHARLLRAALAGADRWFQVERLLAFNRKFDPSWQPRFVAYERYGDLPLAALVVLDAESLIELPSLPRRRPRLAPAPA
jgi:lysyl-tRNA synthetase class 2